LNLWALVLQPLVATRHEFGSVGVRIGATDRLN